MHNGSEHMIFHQINQLASTTRSNNTTSNLQVPIPGYEKKTGYKRWTRVLEEMVLVKMLMEIDPLPMRGSLMMTMVMISPSRREVSPAKQLRRSPRLVPPRFCLVAAESRPKRLLVIFFSSKDFIWEKMGIGEPPGGPRGRGHAPPTLMSRVWAPWPSSLATIFLYLF